MEKTGTSYLAGSGAANVCGRAAESSFTRLRGRVKAPGSALTHLIGCVLAVLAAMPLCVRAYHVSGVFNAACMAVFMVSMILLYAASTSYHTFDRSERVNLILKKLDHMMIFVLIAGSYTPVYAIVIGGRQGGLLLSVIWLLAAAGMLFKFCWVSCPKWVSSLLYIGLGWACIPALPKLVTSLSPGAFAWLLAGGVAYTAGGIIYALKLPLFNSRHKDFGSHEVFHLFVMAGSACHYILMYFFVA